MAVAGMSLDELSEYLNKKVDERLDSKLKSPPAPPTGPFPRYSPPHSLPMYCSRPPGYSPRQGFPQHQGFQQHQGYHPRQDFSPGTRYPAQKFSSPPRYQSRTHHQPSIKSVKIMVTFVETASVFWGQVLNADIVDSTNKLDNDLQEMCPVLPTVTTHINKGHVYATLWQEKWYRCITCHQLDEENSTEVLFVDFGNKEKRNMTELVQLKSPKFMDVPFFACPFRFPKLVAVPEKSMEAIAEFDTDSILTGFVTRSPSPDEYTDIFLNRPCLKNYPMASTYNDLMIELGYAKKVESTEEEPLRTPQPRYFLQSLQQRTRNLFELLKDKDALIQKLQKGNDITRSATTSPSQDVRYPADRHFGVTSPPSLANGQPSRGLEELPIASGSDSDKSIKPEDVLLDCSSSSTPEFRKPEFLEQSSDQPTSEVGFDSSDVSVDSRTLEQQFQEYLIELSADHKRYKCRATSDLSCFQKYRSLHDQIKSFSVNSTVCELKSDVDLCLESLDLASSLISGAKDSNSLQSAVNSRDDNLQKIITLSDTYSKSVLETDIQNKIITINQLILDLKDDVSVALSPQSTEEQLETLAVLEESHKQSITELQSQYSEHLDSLCQIFVSCLATFDQFTNSSTTDELADKTELDLTPKQSLDKLGDALYYTRFFATELSEASLRHADELTPISQSVRSSLSETASSTLSVLQSYLDSNENYRKRAALARNALASKPDLTVLEDIKVKIKVARRQVKLEQIKDEDDDEDGDIIKDAMLKLHALYQEQEAELSNLIELANCTHPELFVEHPQLLYMNKGGGLIKVGWTLQEFILPETAACINSQGLNVYLGFYGDQNIYFVERPLVSLEGELEDDALNLFNSSLPGCFAIIIDKKSLKAFGATHDPPVD